MWVTRVYYHLKPFIPRRLQIYLRRRVVLRQRRSCGDIWPIDERAARPPEGWAGWPGNKRFALVLTHDVETEKGQKRCRPLMEMEDKMGFRSSFNFVPERYRVSPCLRERLAAEGFEVGVHDLRHDGKLYLSKRVFDRRAVRINLYMKEWNAVGFRGGSMRHNLDWLHGLDIEYDASTFDIDPFEPQPDGVGTVFPFMVRGSNGRRGYVELPYTLPQDFTLFVLMREKDIDIWKRKLRWIVSCGGMALVNTHPDYMDFDGCGGAEDEYPARYYEEFLRHLREEYEGRYLHVLPRDVARLVLGGSAEGHGGGEGQ